MVSSNQQQLGFHMESGRDSNKSNRIVWNNVVLSPDPCLEIPTIDLGFESPTPFSDLRCINHGDDHLYVGVSPPKWSEIMYITIYKPWIMGSVSRWCDTGIQFHGWQILERNGGWNGKFMEIHLRKGDFPASHGADYQRLPNTGEASHPFAKSMAQWRVPGLFMFFFRRMVLVFMAYMSPECCPRSRFEVRPCCQVS